MVDTAPRFRIKACASVFIQPVIYRDSVLSSLTATSRAVRLLKGSGVGEALTVRHVRSWLIERPKSSFDAVHVLSHCRQGLLAWIKLERSGFSHGMSKTDFHVTVSCCNFSANTNCRHSHFPSEQTRQHLANSSQLCEPADNRLLIKS